MVEGVALTRELRSIGWVPDRMRGSHHAFRHLERSGHVVVPHQNKDLGVGAVAAIRKQAGL
jgi:predicted RNA binding protein YcfA (HicA-like mRNA interferase family)